MVQTIQIELSLNSNTRRSLIQINALVTGHLQGTFFNSKTQLIQFTEPDKKSKKKYRRVRNELSIKDNIKALKYKSCLNFRACQKKIVEFTESTHTIY